MEGPELLSFDHVLNEHIKNFSFFYFEKNMGPLKVLSDTKLIQNKSKKKTFIISLITFRTFRRTRIWQSTFSKNGILKWLKISKKLIKVFFFQV